MIPFIDLKAQYQALKPQIHERIERVLDHGQFILGPEVRELEERLAAYTGARHCITVASGTEALLISLMTLGIGPELRRRLPRLQERQPQHPGLHQLLPQQTPGLLRRWRRHLHQRRRPGPGLPRNPRPRPE